MKIDRIEIFRYRVPRAQGLKIASGHFVGGANVAVKICTDTGPTGWGEASAFPFITGDSADSNFAMAPAFARHILEANPLAIAVRMREIGELTVGEPSLRSAFDMALHDIAARHAGMPLYRFLGGEARELLTDATIGLCDSVEETADRARQLVAAGFGAIKVKTGRAGIADLAHVASVRDLAGPERSLRIDSNGGWDYPTAVRNLDAMSSLDLEYAEQPVAAARLRSLRELRGVLRTPICVDESVFTACDALEVIRSDAADFINIKLGKAGGLAMATRIEAVADAAGCACMVGCFEESRLGLTAAAHLAAARPGIRFVDLDSAYNWDADPVIGGMTYVPDRGGLIRLPDGPGLGAALDENFLREYGESVTV